MALVITFSDIKWETEPFEWCYVENVFDNYDELLKNLPKEKDYKVFNKAYKSRYVNKMREGYWHDVKLDLQKQFKEKTKCKLCRDKPGYYIGPHTDGKEEIYTFLFYLTPTEEDAGTSIYIPKEEGRESDGSEHLSFEDFTKVKTVPYKPNSMFGFKRSNNSFHGVEPVGITRNIIHLSVRK